MLRDNALRILASGIELSNLFAHLLKVLLNSAKLVIEMLFICKHSIVSVPQSLAVLLQLLDSLLLSPILVREQNDLDRSILLFFFDSPS